MLTGPAAARRLTSLLTAAATTGLVGLAAAGSLSPARADTAPAKGTPATVSADALPTWQINGVVWSQVLVGNTVFATGSFTRARPPGVAAGGSGEVAAGNVFAYDIRTGNRVGSFSHSLNGQGLAAAASPDGQRVYVGGDFTTVDGAAHSHVAAFDAHSGALVKTFAPSVSGEVRALAATNSTVFVGGTFSKANGHSRSRLASFDTKGGMHSWAPATDGTVASMVVAPGDKRLIVGGSFTTLAGRDASGMGAVDATTGAGQSWAANQTIQDGGTSSGITSLTTDGRQIYGSGFAYKTGQFEGTFAAGPQTGELVWANDCLGDTYGVQPIGQVLYSVSHAHDCSMIGAFPNSRPKSINQRRALAFTTYPTGENTGPDEYDWDYSGVPDSSLLQWYPKLAVGAVTQQDQAAWTVTGNSSYIALGGEFPKVNGVAQQGLVRFAVRSAAPNKQGPAAAGDAPSAVSTGPGTVTVRWSAAADPDNQTLTYNLYRSDSSKPIYTTTARSNYWTQPTLSFVDRHAPADGRATYQVKVSDPTGNVLSLPKTAVSAGRHSDGPDGPDDPDQGPPDHLGWPLPRH